MESGDGEHSKQEAEQARLAEERVRAEMEEVQSCNKGLLEELEARLAEAGEETGRLRKVRGRQGRGGSRRKSSDAGWMWVRSWRF